MEKSKNSVQVALSVFLSIGFCFFLMLLPMSSVFSQCPDEDNNFLDKYWASKNTLENDFVLNAMDDETGDLLNDGIGIWDCNTNTYTMSGYGIPANFIRMSPVSGDAIQSTAHWGDGTIYLGRYIAMLCTEYELLRRNGQTAMKKKTLNQLFLALQAYKRLDMTANKLYGRYLECIGEPCGFGGVDLSGYSGFFLRDDVRWLFQNEWPNEWNNEHDVSSDFINEENCQNIDESIPCAFSSTPCTFFECSQNFVSQDQVMGMLFGLSFVKKFVTVQV
jgi:hypothetical protein